MVGEVEFKVVDIGSRIDASNREGAYRHVGSVGGGVAMVVGREWIVGRRLAPDVVRIEYENQEEGGGEKERAPGEGDGGGAKCRKECHQNEGKNLS